MNLLSVSVKIANKFQPDAFRGVGKIQNFQVRILNLCLGEIPFQELYLPYQWRIKIPIGSRICLLLMCILCANMRSCIRHSQRFLIFKSFLNICKIVISLNQSPAIFSVILPYIFIQSCTSCVWSFIGARVSEIFLWVSKKILGSARQNNCWGKNSQNVRI